MLEGGFHLQALGILAADEARVVEADDGKAGQGAAPVQAHIPQVPGPVGDAHGHGLVAPVLVEQLGRVEHPRIHLRSHECFGRWSQLLPAHCEQGPVCEECCPCPCASTKDGLTGIVAWCIPCKGSKASLGQSSSPHSGPASTSASLTPIRPRSMQQKGSCQLSSRYIVQRFETPMAPTPRLCWQPSLAAAGSAPQQRGGPDKAHGLQPLLVHSWPSGLQQSCDRGR